MRRAAMCPNAACVEGAAGISLPQVGVWGSSPRNFFANTSSEKEGILEQKRKKAKKDFSQKLGKRGFCLQKKVKKGLKGFPGRPVNL